MQFPALLALLASLALVHAGCFNADLSKNAIFAEEGPKAAARGWVDQLCNGGDGNLSGAFVGGQIKSKCGQLNDGQKVQLSVQWTQDSAMTLDDKDCKWRLSDEINGCEAGGQSEIAGWKFKADPNRGTC